MPWILAELLPNCLNRCLMSFMKNWMLYLLGLFVTACSTSPRAPALTYRSGNQLAEADKLGYHISDPVMRKKILELYKRQDIVVEQVVIR